MGKQEFVNKIQEGNYARMQRSLGATLLLLLYVYGLVVVKGFWAMAIAILVPIYSWYLAIEQIAKYIGLGV